MREKQSRLYLGGYIMNQKQLEQGHVLLKLIELATTYNGKFLSSSNMLNGLKITYFKFDDNKGQRDFRSMVLSHNLSNAFQNITATETAVII